jgi:hypothetical protein
VLPYTYSLHCLGCLARGMMHQLKPVIMSSKQIYAHLIDNAYVKAHVIKLPTSRSVTSGKYNLGRGKLVISVHVKVSEARRLTCAPDITFFTTFASLVRYLRR